MLRDDEVNFKILSVFKQLNVFGDIASSVLKNIAPKDQTTESIQHSLLTVK
jgi:hypothetical protein